MTEITHQVIGYRITFETFNGFFGAWLKHNLFTRRRLIFTLVFTATLIAITIITCWRTFAIIASEPNLPIWWTIPIFAVAAIVMFLFCFLIIAIPMYILSPLVSYLWLIVTFLLGPVRKRINSAEVSQQGISKSFEQHNHLTPWHTVYDLVETKKSLLVFTTRNCAMMIPKAGFTNLDLANAFWSAARTYWQQARAISSNVT